MQAGLHTTGSQIALLGTKFAVHGRYEASELRGVVRRRWCRTSSSEVPTILLQPMSVTPAISRPDARIIIRQRHAHEPYLINAIPRILRELRVIPSPHPLPLPSPHSKRTLLSRLARLQTNQARDIQPQEPHNRTWKPTPLRESRWTRS